MRFDAERAEKSLVEIVDPLNGDRVVGLGFRLLDDALATSCQCLPRPRGAVHFPDPDAPALLVLVRARLPGTEDTAYAVVTRAEAYAGLAILEPRSAAGLGVPDELNPRLSAEALVRQREPALGALSPVREGPVYVRSRKAGWLEARATGTRLTLDGPGARLDSADAGGPVLDVEGRLVGLVGACPPDGSGARLCLAADHLPGWALRRAGSAVDPEPPPTRAA